jgi:hypothetical protein
VTKDVPNYPIEQLLLPISPELAANMHAEVSAAAIELKKAETRG